MMVTKNEMVAILAALTTDFDTATEKAARDVAESERRDQAINDAYIEVPERYVEHRRRAV